MVIQYLLEKYNGPIDIIALMTRGYNYAQHVHNRIIQLDSNRKSRLIKFYPVGRCGGNLDKEKYEKAISLGDISPEISFEKFRKDPRTRFVKNKPKSENIAVLIDDILYNGETIRNSIKEMIVLGYNKDKIYILLEEETSYPFGRLCIPYWTNLDRRNPLGEIV